MTTIYRVWLHRGVRAKDEIGLYASEEVAQHVADNYDVSKSGESTSVERADLNDSGNVAQYQADAQLARIRKVLTPEEIELLRSKQGLL